MAIVGAHMLLYTPEADALRAMLRDVFRFKSVDAGGGWLIFALPPAELGVHPSGDPANKSASVHQLSFMCDDIAATIEELKSRGVHFDSGSREEEFGIVAMMSLPGNVKVMLYEPHHKTAIGMTGSSSG